MASNGDGYFVCSPPCNSTKKTGRHKTQVQERVASAAKSIIFETDKEFPRGHTQ
jgi:hypothetical protein